jgi:transcriptional regulator with XRE-family HTH domain
MTDEKQISKKLGANIAKFRRQRNLTQEQLAEATESGRTTIQFIERGDRFPRTVTLVKLSRALKVPIEKLFEGIK